MSIENYLCTNCNTVGFLSAHGRCATCGSVAVISVAQVHKALKSTVDSHYGYLVTCGAFESFVQSVDKMDADLAIKTATSSPIQPWYYNGRADDFMPLKLNAKPISRDEYCDWLRRES